MNPNTPEVEIGAILWVALGRPATISTFDTFWGPVLTGPQGRGLREYVEERSARRVRLGLSEPQAVRSCLLGLYAGVAFAAGGKSTFAVTESLAGLLFLTDIDESRPTFPLAGFDVTLPPGVLTHSHDVIRPASARERSPKRLDVLRIRVTAADDHLLARFDDPASEGTVLVTAGWDDRLEDTEAGRFAAKVRALILGLCSFVNAHPEELVPENRKAIERDIAAGKEPRGRVFVVGRSVKLDRRLREAAFSGRTPVFSLQHRFIVRGHWRQQPVGRRLREGELGPRRVKKIWVLPFWKGPDDSEAWQRTYRLGAQSSP